MEDGLAALCMTDAQHLPMTYMPATWYAIYQMIRHVKCREMHVVIKKHLWRREGGPSSRDLK